MQSLSAACAIHPDIGAVFTCERCGAFGCEDCRAPFRSLLCHACVQRVVPEGALTVRSLLRDSFSLLRRNLSGVGILLAGELGYSLLRLLLLPRIPLLAAPLRQLVSDAAGSFSAAVFLAWTGPLLLQQPGRSLLTSLGVGLRRFFPLFLMSAFLSLVEGPELWFLVLLSSYLFVCLYLVPALVVLEEFDLLPALQDSYQLTRGHRWSLLAVLVLLSIALEGPRQLYLFLLPQLGGSPWHGMGLLLTLGLRCWQALWGAFFYSSVLLAWMRLTGRVPAQA